jgi:hypothetical protein
MLKGGAGASKVVLERMPEGRLAERRFNIPALPKGARLEFLYLSTEDCTFCRQWESSSKAAFLASAEGKAVRFVEVKGATLKAPIDASHYPASHKWAFEQMGPSRGVPRFLLAIDGKIMLNAYGTGGFRDVFAPAVKAVVQKRGEGG